MIVSCRCQAVGRHADVSRSARTRVQTANRGRKISDPVDSSLARELIPLGQISSAPGVRRPGRALAH